MGRMIVGAFDGISVTNDADQNIWAITAGSANKIIIHGFELTSAATVAEDLAILLRRESTAAAGTAVTEENLDEDDGAITATMITLDLTPGTPDGVLGAWQWEQLGPLTYLPTPEMRPVVQESGIIVLNLGTALTATTAMSGYVVWEEI
jgi:hypothetical protein